MASGRRQLPSTSSTKQHQAADKRQQSRPRINPIKRTRPPPGGGASQTGGLGTSGSLRDVIRNQQYIIRQYEQLRQQGIFRRSGGRLTNLTLHNNRRPAATTAKSLTAKSPRLTRRRTPQRRTATSTRNNNPPNKRTRRQPTAGRGSPGGPTGPANKKLNATDLDAQLDQYMGDDVRKARLDTELEAYFSRSENLLSSGGGKMSGGEHELQQQQQSELGEICSSSSQ